MTTAPKAAAHPAPAQHTITHEARQRKETQLIHAKRKQAGIGFPSAGIQTHLLIIRLDLARNLAPKPPVFAPPDGKKVVQDGLKRLCGLFARIDRGDKKIEVLSDKGKLERQPLSHFNFSATVGFGTGFFDLLGIAPDKRPAKLREMPDHDGLGDTTPYCIGQSDMIIQLGASEDFINRWVLENALQPITDSSNPDDTSDIVSAIGGWATITDMHAGFQRVDGRNLQGFNDGVSNPRRLSPLFDDVVWTTPQDEPNPNNVDGTYMVFQKIVHDLDQWRALDVDEQQEWVGRSKGTGLLLGSMPEDEDAQLAKDLQSSNDAVRQAALEKWTPLFKAQANPETRFFDHKGATKAEKLNGDPVFSEVPNKCPAWAHVRKANPRQEDDLIEKKIIFRRGYPFMEFGLDGKTRSGLLFVCFQRDITAKFEFIKRNWFGFGKFPVPIVRPFTDRENDNRHSHGRFTADELNELTANERKLVGLSDPDAFADALKTAAEEETQQTGGEGLAGPSEHGVTPTGEFLAIVPLGGGYYFVPPIPNKDIAAIGQPFFD